jgi:hypothetical protein
MSYVCPVCGYNGLRRPPKDYLICPSCGTEFDYHDSGAGYAELRSGWLASGAKWHSRVIPPPPDWDAEEQLLRAGLTCKSEALDPQTTSGNKHSG